MRDFGDKNEELLRSNTHNGMSKRQRQSFLPKYLSRLADIYLGQQ